MEIRPQPGPQTQFLSTASDICIYGGAAGGGKTFGLLLSPLRHITNPKFGTVIFRKHANQIMVEGGLLDESKEIYSFMKYSPVYKSSPPRWSFPSGAKITFAHIERDDDLFKWQGAQITEIGFDELTHFSERQFFYMLSRNRSTSGINPTIKATCNPDADSWVAKFIEWWIDQDTGYPIKERSGVIRWFIRRNEALYWADSRKELIEQFNLVTPEEQAEPRSVTFILSNVYDNKILLEKNPSYLSNLKALSEVERERLLYGNWKIKPASGMFFKRSQIGEMVSVVPKDVQAFVRAWDLAATAETEGGEPAYTAGVLIGKRANGKYIIIDVINVRQSASEVRATMRHTASIDNAKYGFVQIRFPQDPGQAGKDQAQSLIKNLSGYSVKAVIESGSKETRAEPVAAQWQAGNFDVLVADWNEMYLAQLESFPSSKFKDMVDATSTAFAELENEMRKRRQIQTMNRMIT
jgi:predicted phage terminase large subunit-like protein